jgi:hypothetical protein
MPQFVLHNVRPHHVVVESSALIPHFFTMSATITSWLSHYRSCLISFSHCPPLSRRGWVIGIHAPFLSSQCPPLSHRGWVIIAHAPVLSSQCPPPSRRGWIISAHAPFLHSVRHHHVVVESLALMPHFCLHNVRHHHVVVEPLALMSHFFLHNVRHHHVVVESLALLLHFRFNVGCDTASWYWSFSGLVSVTAGKCCYITYLWNRSRLLLDTFQFVVIWHPTVYSAKK